MPEPPPSDFEARVRGGELDAFGELVRRHQGWLKATLRSRVPDWTVADDLVQEVFITAFRRINEYRGDGEIESWLRAIAMNHLRNFIRKKRMDYVGGHHELEKLMEHNPPAATGSSSLEALRLCLQRLDGDSRELLSERYIKGRNIRELSEIFGRRGSALTMQLHRLREVLAGCVRNKLKGADR